MKIIGLLLTWNNLEFFKCALQQALDFCDEVLVVEGCHSKSYSKQSTDGTYGYIRDFKHPKLKVCSLKKRMDRYDRTQQFLRDEIPRKSQYWKSGNWVLQLDDDIFLFKQDLSRLKNVMQNSEYSALTFKVRYFIYNFRFNFLQKGGSVCYRISDDVRLLKIGFPHNKEGERFKAFCLDDITCFHYTYVKKPERMKARWVMSIEKGTQTSIDRFDKWMNIRWKAEGDIFQKEEEFAEIRPGGGLNIYTGKHPAVLDKHSWLYIKDVRMIK